MKYFSITLVILFISFQVSAKKDSLSTVRGSFYYVSLRIEQDEKPPMFAAGYASSLPININNKNLKSFICEMYGQMIYTISMSEGVDINAIIENRLPDSSDEERQSKVDRVSDAWDHFGERKRLVLEDSTIVFLQVLPFTGQLWVVEKDRDLNRYITVNPQISEECYKSNFIYYLKDIDRIYPFDVCTGLIYTQ